MARASEVLALPGRYCRAWWSSPCTRFLRCQSCFPQIPRSVLGAAASQSLLQWRVTAAKSLVSKSPCLVSLCLSSQLGHPSVLRLLRVPGWERQLRCGSPPQRNHGRRCPFALCRGRLGDEQPPQLVPCATGVRRPPGPSFPAVAFVYRIVTRFSLPFFPEASNSSTQTFHYPPRP